ncbi:MAG: metallophosphoesterase family protein [Actinobacteria bacterium]|nr:metallophosphoesterase family protein [Actinomycetota bacterium]
MLIGVLADTHLTGEPVPEYIIDAMRGVDMILHAGDILDMAVLDQLAVLAETIAVRGNMDRGDVNRILPARRMIEVKGFKIGLTHGFGAPEGMMQKVGSQFDDVDCIVFGHTHKPLVKDEKGIIYFNPGTPIKKAFTSGNSVGFLEVSDKIIPRILDMSGV